LTDPRRDLSYREATTEALWLETPKGHVGDVDVRGHVPHPPLHLKPNHVSRSTSTLAQEQAGAAASERTGVKRHFSFMKIDRARLGVERGVPMVCGVADVDVGDKASRQVYLCDHYEALNDPKLQADS